MRLYVSVLVLTVLTPLILVKAQDQPDTAHTLNIRNTARRLRPEDIESSTSKSSSEFLEFEDISVESGTAIKKKSESSKKYKGSTNGSKKHKGSFDFLECKDTASTFKRGKQDGLDCSWASTEQRCNQNVHVKNGKKDKASRVCPLTCGLCTQEPSARPSDFPSYEPSFQPSYEPSFSPSDQPSIAPSDEPSSQPSSKPSSLPSDQPSDEPSSQPSSKPSSLPSDQPSDEPSSQPSSKPSSLPSDQPSDEPSSQPSSKPSSSPSEQPSMSSSPSNEPSVSSQPTNDCSEVIKGGLSTVETDRAAVAMLLSQDVYDYSNNGISSGSQVSFEGSDGTFYIKDVDAIVTMKVDEKYCVVAFRGTNDFDINGDFASNLDLDPYSFEDKGLQCNIHDGYNTAYFALEEETETFLEDCTQECSDCDVVFTGHSQGGGVAQIAALYYKKSLEIPPDNMYILTFGSTLSLSADCELFFTKEERCNTYRYILTTRGPFGTGLQYDPVPYAFEVLLGLRSNTFGENGVAYLGHEIFVSEDESTAVALGPFDGHHTTNANNYANFPWLSPPRPHEVPIYAETLDSQRSNGASTGGFLLNNLCIVSGNEAFLCADGLTCQYTGRSCVFGFCACLAPNCKQRCLA